MNKTLLRRLHAQFAPIMVFPLLLTAITGVIFQLVHVTGQDQGFFWLLELHVGKFGRLDLSKIYPFLNALGLIVLAITGISMWLQRRPRRRRSQ